MHSISRSSSMKLSDVLMKEFKGKGIFAIFGYSTLEKTSPSVTSQMISDSFFYRIFGSLSNIAFTIDRISDEIDGAHIQFSFWLLSVVPAYPSDGVWGTPPQGCDGVKNIPY